MPRLRKRLPKKTPRESSPVGEASNRRSLRASKRVSYKINTDSTNSPLYDQYSDEGAVSSTSPFKGYPPNESEVILVSDDSQAKETNSQESRKDQAFENLLEADLRSNFPEKNMKTYESKRPLSPEKKLLQFHDCENRDNILQWLDDTRNTFDRLTQTQTQHCSDDDSPIDMPSVSQVSIPKATTKTTRKSPYKLRARSLNIHVTKNARIDRIKRHSLAGNSPEAENYKIEDIHTNEDIVPVDKMFVNLIEDEFLDSIEQQIQHEQEMKNHSGSGWERMKNVEKSIGNYKKPNQLNISLDQSRKIDNSKTKSYDMNVLEDYFQRNMEKLTGYGDKNLSNESEGRASIVVVSPETCEDALIHEARNLLISIKSLREGDRRLDVLKPLLCEMKFVLNTVSAIATQTDRVTQAEIGLQSETFKNNVAIQTEVQSEEVEVQTEMYTNNAAAQTENNLRDAAIQTEQIIQSEAEKHESNNNDIKSDPKQSPDAETNFELIQNEDQGENPVKMEEITKSQEYLYLDGVCFDSEEAWGEALIRKRSQNTNLEPDRTKEPEIESPLLISAPPSKVVSNSAQKRFRDPSPIQSDSKRPCNKFLKEDLSIDFETERSISPEENPQTKENQHSNYLDEVLRKHEESLQRIRESSSPRVKSDEDLIDDCNILIENATKAIHLRERTPPAAIESPTNERTDETVVEVVDFDYFKTNLRETDEMTDFTTPKKAKRVVERPRRETREKFSESLFGNSLQLLNDTEADNEVRSILAPKIRVLQNVVVKPPGKTDDCVSVSSDDVVFSDVDIVETTPQKKTSICGASHKSEKMTMDMTLPPPLEFQDNSQDSDVTLVNLSPPPNPPPNKITSTPYTYRGESEKIPFSPIARAPKSRSMIEIAQQAKFSPLIIVKKPASQSSLLSKMNTSKQRSITSYISTSQDQPKAISQNKPTKPCIGCSRIKQQELLGISTLANRGLVTFSSTFSKTVTHMVVGINENNCIENHTIKYVASVAAGIWVVSYEWIKQCVKQNTIVPEEPYEVLDVSGVAGPRESRLAKHSNRLLKGFKIYVAPLVTSITQKEVENIVISLQGQVVPRPEDLLDKEGHICLIITEANSTQDLGIYDTWMDALRVVIVDIEWLSRCVGQYKLESLRRFALCLDESLIDDLDYPPSLLANVPLSLLS